jgi:hypothetical protein
MFRFIFNIVLILIAFGIGFAIKISLDHVKQQEQKRILNETVWFNGYHCIVTDVTGDYAELVYLDKDDGITTVYIPYSKAVSFLLDKQTNQ